MLLSFLVSKIASLDRRVDLAINQLIRDYTEINQKLVLRFIFSYIVYIFSVIR